MTNREPFPEADSQGQPGVQPLDPPPFDPGGAWRLAGPAERCEAACSDDVPEGARQPRPDGQFPLLNVTARVETSGPLLALDPAT